MQQCMRVYKLIYIWYLKLKHVILHIFFLTNKKPINSPMCLMMYFPSLIVTELLVITSILFALVDVLLEKYYTLNISTKKKPHFFMIRVLFAFEKKKNSLHKKKYLRISLQRLYYNIQ